MSHSCFQMGRMFSGRVKPRSAPEYTIPRYEANDEGQHIL